MPYRLALLQLRTPARLALVTVADAIFVLSKWAAAIAFVALLVLLALALVDWSLGGEARSDARHRNHAHRRPR